jgi:hypothetical protein
MNVSDHERMGLTSAGAMRKHQQHATGVGTVCGIPPGRMGHAAAGYL